MGRWGVLGTVSPSLFFIPYYLFHILFTTFNGSTALSAENLPAKLNTLYHFISFLK